MNGLEDERRRMVPKGTQTTSSSVGNRRLQSAQNIKSGITSRTRHKRLIHDRDARALGGSGASFYAACFPAATRA